MEISVIHKNSKTTKFSEKNVKPLYFMEQNSEQNYDGFKSYLVRKNNLKMPYNHSIAKIQMQELYGCLKNRNQATIWEILNYWPAK